MESQRFAVVVASAGRGRLLVPVPFNPDQVWGTKQRHHISGTVGRAIATRLLDLRWIRRIDGTRALRITDAGHDGLATLGVTI